MGLLDGFNHVTILTRDTERLHEFYREVFDAVVAGEMSAEEGVRRSVIDLGGGRELSIVQIEGSTDAERQTPMFGRGRIDHLGLQATCRDAFDTIRERLIARGSSDGFVTDFGSVLSVFFRDLDGLEGEVCAPNPNRQPGVFHPPGTPATGYRQQR